MIEDNIINFSVLFFLILSIFFIGSGKSLRPKILFDQYTFLYFLLASIVSLHLFVFFNSKVDDDFVLMFALAMSSFSLFFFGSSYYFNKKIEAFIVRYKSQPERINSGVNRLFGFKIFFTLFLIFIGFSFIVLNDNFQKFMTLENIHGQNAAYITENYSSRLVFYLSSFLLLSNSYFMLYVLTSDSKTFKKNGLTIFYFVIQFFIFVMSSSRASILYLFLPLGLIVFYLINAKPNVYKKIVRIQFVLLSFAVAYALYVGYVVNNDLLQGLQEIGMRLFMTSDVTLWYHLIGGLNIRMFDEYNFLYYFHPILKVLGLSESISSLGIRVAELAGNTDFGKGPVPTFIYESYLISKSITYSVFYSGILGALIPCIRYLSIKSIMEIDRKKEYFIMAFLFYYFAYGPAGDSMLFETMLFVYLIFSAVVFFILKLRALSLKRQL